MGAGHAHAMYVHQHSPVHHLAPEVKIVAALAFTGIVVASEPRHVSMVLPYPSLLNGLGAVSLDGSGSNGSAVSTNAHANSCIPPKPAIP